MPDLSWLQKTAIDIVIIAIILGGMWVWGDVHGKSEAAKTYASDLAKALQVQQAKDNKIIQSLQTNITTLDKERSDVIANGAKLQKQIDLLKKKHPLPADCVPDPDIVRIYRSASETK